MLLLVLKAVMLMLRTIEEESMITSWSCWCSGCCWGCKCCCSRVLWVGSAAEPAVVSWVMPSTGSCGLLQGQLLLFYVHLHLEKMWPAWTSLSFKHMFTTRGQSSDYLYNRPVTHILSGGRGRGRWRALKFTSKQSHGWDVVFKVCSSFFIGFFFTAATSDTHHTEDSI